MTVLCGSKHTTRGKDFVFHIPQGKSFGDFYHLGEEIGHGSSGTVFDCSATKVISNVTVRSSWISKLLSRLVSAKSNTGEKPTLACKILMKTGCDSKGWLEKFGLRGIQAALATSHPCIVRYHEFIEDSTNMYAVMDRYSGQDLFDYVMQHRPLSEPRASAIMTQVLKAISYIHNIHAIHRDIKPENFMFESKSPCANLKLVDFGSCTCESIVTPNPNTSSILPLKRRSIVGTTGYCPPEVFSGIYNEKVDLFSAGVLLFIMVTGEMPFECRDVNQYQASLDRAKRDGVWKVLNMKGDRLRDCSGECKELIEQLLSIDESLRPSAAVTLDHIWFQNANLFRSRPTHDVLPSLRKMPKTDISPLQRETATERDSLIVKWF